MVITCNLVVTSPSDFPVFHVQWGGRTALMWASESGCLDVVKELLRAQAGVDMQDEVCRVCVRN